MLQLSFSEKTNFKHIYYAFGNIFDSSSICQFSWLPSMTKMSFKSKLTSIYIHMYIHVLHSKNTVHVFDVTSNARLQSHLNRQIH